MKANLGRALNWTTVALTVTVVPMSLAAGLKLAAGSSSPPFWLIGVSWAAVISCLSCLAYPISELTRKPNVGLKKAFNELLAALIVCSTVGGLLIGSLLWAVGAGNSWIFGCIASLVAASRPVGLLGYMALERAKRRNVNSPTGP